MAAASRSSSSRPVDVVGPAGQQVLVLVHRGPCRRCRRGQRSGRPGRRRRRARTVGSWGSTRGQERQQRGVDDDDVVLGVVGDVDQLLGGEPDVEGVQHGAHGGHREVGLEVLGVVPHEGRHPLVAVDAEVVAQRVGELGGAGGRARRSCGGAVGRRRSRWSPADVAVNRGPVPRIREISSGTSCMVLSTASSRGALWSALCGDRGVPNSAHIPLGMSLPGSSFGRGSAKLPADTWPATAGRARIRTVWVRAPGPHGACRARATPRS